MIVELTYYERRMLRRIIDWKSMPIDHRNRLVAESLVRKGLVIIGSDNRARFYARAGAATR